MAKFSSIFQKLFSGFTPRNAITNTCLHIFNGIQLSPVQKHLLSLGLKFVPKPPDTSNQAILQAISSFDRRIRCFDFFTRLGRDRPFNACLTTPHVSTWVPPSTSAWASEALSLLHTKTSHLLSSDPVEKNNYAIPKAWKVLRHLPHDIKVLQSDKNVGLVVMKLSMYNEMVLEHLQQEAFYKEVPETELCISLESIKAGYESLMDKVHVSYRSFFKQWLPYCTQLPIFHVLPKVHKMPIPIDYAAQPPSRPIIASLRYYTTPWSKWLGVRLEELSSQQPFLLRDSKQLVQQLEHLEFPLTAKLMTADATSLYTYIPQNTLIQFIFDLASGMADALFLKYVVKFVITNNFFIYNNKFFHQKMGIAMGTNAAVHLANLFLAHTFDQKIASHAQVLFYRRYIDDILIVYLPNESQEDWYNFNQFLQGAQQGIHWNLDSLLGQTHFLDANITFSDGKINFSVYQKPSNIYSYLPVHTNHPRHCLKGFIKAELIRYVRLNTLETTFIHIRKLFYQRLCARGFKRVLLDPIFISVSFHDREKFISDVQNQTLAKRTIPIIVPYSQRPLLLGLKKLVHEMAPSFESHGVRLLLAYKKPKSIFQLAVRTSLSSEQQQLLQNPTSRIRLC